jgi:small multidrug resistance pump
LTEIARAAKGGDPIPEVALMSLPAAYTILFASIVFEIIGTSALLASQTFTRIGPSLVVAVCYSLAIVGLSLTFRTIPMGIAYAIWSGLGIVLISAVGWVVFGQRLDSAAVVGLGLIVAGVVVVNLSDSVGH